jgi:lysophospholipase
MSSEPTPSQLVNDPFVDALEGLETFRVEGPDDKTIRVGFAPHKGKKLRGSVIISPGRTEYIEKHATTALDLVKRGYNVLIVDQRGQGWSDRLTANPMAGHMDSFDKAAIHLGLAIEAAGKRLKGPHILLCHSMGGCIGLQGLLNGQLPSITAAAFSAPMWGLVVPPYAKPMAKILSSIQQDEAIAPTTPKVWKPESFEGNAVTHDPQHFARNNALFLAEPALQIGGPTNGWLSGAFSTMASFTPERLAQLQLPILVVSGEADTVVDNSAHVRIAGQLPHAVLRTIAGAKHELLHELPHLRDQFWGHFDQWTAGLSQAEAAKAQA